MSFPGSSNPKLPLLQQLLAGQEERLKHFAKRMDELKLSPREWVIVVLHVDDPVAGVLARMLVPDGEPLWNAMRLAGVRPFARGIAAKNLVESFLINAGPALQDPSILETLKRCDEPALVYIDLEAVLVGTLRGTDA